MIDLGAWLVVPEEECEAGRQAVAKVADERSRWQILPVRGSVAVLRCRDKRKRCAAVVLDQCLDSSPLLHAPL